MGEPDGGPEREHETLTIPEPDSGWDFNPETFTLTIPEDDLEIRRQADGGDVEVRISGDAGSVLYEAVRAGLTEVISRQFLDSWERAGP